MTGQLSLATLSLTEDQIGQTTLVRDEGDLAVSQKYMHSLGYSRDGRLAAAGNIDGVVFLYDVKTREFKARFASKLDAHAVFCISVSQLVISLTQIVHILDHNLAVRALAFDRSSTSLISAGQDLHCFVSDVET